MSCAETRPIKTLAELWKWKPHKNSNPVEPLRPRTAARKMVTSNLCNGAIYDFVKISSQAQSPKVMVCHDMKGGYIDDRFDQGCFGLEEEPYRFIHWSLIDTFVYFSHHLITIPPIGWVNAAHKNGVEMLGTIITEFDDGKEICDNLLQSQSTVDNFVDVCCLIAISHQLDGWLLNIENKLDVEQVPNMMYLVEKLTGEMHARAGSSTKVIWYDSVTHDGKLKWQNCLNNENVKYFDKCDGIYLNYGWRVTPETNDLDETVEFLQNYDGNTSRASAVYVGVDVFGRGCYGGGGFHCDKAIKEIVRDRRGKILSIAIFAPGWTHETKPQINSDVKECFGSGSFFQREITFWSLLQDFLNFRGINQAREDNAMSEPLIFYSKFNSGSGLINKRKQNDPKIRENAQNPAWFLNLNLQDSLPVLFSHASLEEDVDAAKNTKPFDIYLSSEILIDNSKTRKTISTIHDINEEKSINTLIMKKCPNKGNWIFCNRVSTIPIFIHELTTEKRYLLINLRLSLPIENLEENNMKFEELLISPRPHLVLQFGGKTNKTKEYIQQTSSKLCPYLFNRKSCLHASYDEEEQLLIGEVIGDIRGYETLDSKPCLEGDVQYLFRLNDIKAKMGLHSLTISTILMELPLGHRTFHLNEFTIYEV